MSDEVSGPVVVIPVVPITNLIKNGSSTSGTASAIFTTASDKDTYLSGVLLGFSSNASADATLFTVTVTVLGQTVRIAELRKQTLTAESRSIYAQFRDPIKVDRNTAVNIQQSTFTVGGSSVTGIVYGYTEETTANT